jgi:hypothetical protein
MLKEITTNKTVLKGLKIKNVLVILTFLVGIGAKFVVELLA